MSDNKKRHKWVRAVSTYETGRVAIGQACSVCGIYREKSEYSGHTKYYNPKNKSYPWQEKAGECLTTKSK